LEKIAWDKCSGLHAATKEDSFIALGSRYDGGYKGKVKDEYFRFMVHLIFELFFPGGHKIFKKKPKMAKSSY
jgi:hypothetical protein